MTNAPFPVPSARIARAAALAAATASMMPACSEQDTTAPAPPVVDELASPTLDGEPLVTGTAEFGAVVTIRGGAETVTTTADPYTAAFKAHVPLVEGDNELSVTATDAAGNESQATTIAVTYIVPPGPPASIDIEGPATVRAGEPARFTVTVRNVFGNPIPDAPFTLSTDAPAGSTTFDVPATVTFCAPGTWTVTAEAGDGSLSASTAIDVTVGRPASLSLSTTPSPAVVTAGETVAYATDVRDSCGNETDDFVAMSTNAPGAVVAGGTVTGLTRAGNWVLVAEVPSAGLVDTADIAVDADASTTVVALTLTSHAGFVGIPIGYSVAAVDGFGNPIDTAPVVTVPTDPGATIDPATQTVTFSIEGTHTITATVGTASDSDFAVITNPDLGAPSLVEITEPAPGTVFPTDATVTVRVHAVDDRGLAQIALQATGARDRFDTRIVPNDPITGLPRTDYTAEFSLDVGGRFGSIALIAQAIDTSGNYATSAEVVVFVDPAANLGLPAGFSAQTVAAEGLLRRPRGIAIDGAGMIYVANNGGSAEVVRVDPATGAQTTFTPALPGSTAEDIVYYAPDGVFFLTDSDSNRLYRIDASGVATQWSADVGGNPRSLIVDGTPGILVHYDNDRVRRFDPSDPPPATPTFTMRLDAIYGGGGYGLDAVETGYIVTDAGNSDDIFTFDPPATDGAAVVNAVRVAEAPPIDQAREIVYNPASGFAYAANEGDGRIIRIDIAGCTTSPCPTATIASGFGKPWGLAFDGSGALLVTDEERNHLVRIDGPL